MNTEDNKLDIIYNEIIVVIERLLGEDNNPLSVAAVLASQALGLYKTVLSDADYEIMIENIVSKKDSIRPYEARTLH